MKSSNYNSFLRIMSGHGFTRRTLYISDATGTAVHKVCQKPTVLRKNKNNNSNSMSESLESFSSSDEENTTGIYRILEFHHEYFQRGKPELLPFVTHYSASSSSGDPFSTGSSSVVNITGKNTIKISKNSRTDSEPLSANIPKLTPLITTPLRESSTSNRMDIKVPNPFPHSEQKTLPKPSTYPFHPPPIVPLTNRTGKIEVPSTVPPIFNPRNNNHHTVNSSLFSSVPPNRFVQRPSESTFRSSPLRQEIKYTSTAYIPEELFSPPPLTKLSLLSFNPRLYNRNTHTWSTNHPLLEKLEGTNPSEKREQTYNNYDTTILSILKEDESNSNPGINGYSNLSMDGINSTLNIDDTNTDTYTYSPSSITFPPLKLSGPKAFYGSASGPAPLPYVSTDEYNPSNKNDHYSASGSFIPHFRRLSLSGSSSTNPTAGQVFPIATNTLNRIYHDNFSKSLNNDTSTTNNYIHHRNKGRIAASSSFLDHADGRYSGNTSSVPYPFQNDTDDEIDPRNNDPLQLLSYLPSSYDQVLTLNMTDSVKDSDWLYRYNPALLPSNNHFMKGLLSPITVPAVSPRNHSFPPLISSLSTILPIPDSRNTIQPNVRNSFRYPYLASDYTNGTTTTYSPASASPSSSRLFYYEDNVTTGTTHHANGSPSNEISVPDTWLDDVENKEDDDQTSMDIVL